MAAACAPAQLAEAAPPPVGISDNKPSTFTDVRFGELGLRYARLVVAYDAALTEPQRVDAWLHAARAAGAEPHVAFEHRRGDRCPQAPCELPSVEAYANAFAAFRARYPDVHVFTPWNEANHSSQPTARSPQHAASYYEVVVARCPGCRIVAADILDSDNMMTWLAAFRASARTPANLWGLHNYGDVNDNSTVATDQLLAAVAGEVWLTETGGIVYFRDVAGRVIRPYDERRARDAVGRVFGLLARSPRRITRAYLYHWQAGEASLRFDAGLIRADGSPRPAFGIVRQQMRPDLATSIPPAIGMPGDRPPAVRPSAERGAERGAAAGGHTARLRLGTVARLQPRRRLRLAVTCRAGGGRCQGSLELRHVGRRLSWRGRFDLLPGRRTGVILAPVNAWRPLPRRARRLAALARLTGSSAPVRRVVRVLAPRRRQNAAL